MNTWEFKYVPVTFANICQHLLTSRWTTSHQHPMHCSYLLKSLFVNSTKNIIFTLPASPPLCVLETPKCLRLNIFNPRLALTLSAYGRRSEFVAFGDVFILRRDRSHRTTPGRVFSLTQNCKGRWWNLLNQFLISAYLTPLTYWWFPQLKNPCLKHWNRRRL